MSRSPEPYTAETIRDFGNQWQIHHRVDDDYWCDVSMLADYLGPLLGLSELEGKNVAEVGSGSGRVIRMLSECGVASLHAIEPSSGIDVLRKNTHELNNLFVHASRGDNFEIGDLDYIFSLGVIQFIQDPIPTLKNICDNLKDGGRCVIWVYGKENNRLYLAIFRLMHSITRRMNDQTLDRLCDILNSLLTPYIVLCRYLPLPMRKYVINVFAKCGMEKRKYIIFDQLNPSYVKYYEEQELIETLQEAGFHDIQTYHRHGYSWTAIAGR